jgi:hypothetical protein
MEEVMARASEIETWLRRHTPELLRCRLRLWSEARDGTRRRYWRARLGPHRLYFGSRPELRDRALEIAAQIRKSHFGRDAVLREMLPAWRQVARARPSWRRLRDQILFERGEYFRGGRIRRRRARSSQHEDTP